MLLSSPENLEVTTCKSILAKVEERARKKWGQKWLANLTHEYVAIAKSQGDETATFERRRAQLGRTFENGSCNADTLLILVAAVDCKIQLACLEVEDL
jgi:hypothetical protein